MNFLILENEEYSIEAMEIYKNLGHIYLAENYNSEIIEVLVIRLSKFMNESFLCNFPNIKYIITPTTSLTHIDIEYINNKNIKIISLRDCKEKLKIITSSAEHALTLALSLERNFHNFLKENLEDWDRYRYKIREISSKNIGIIGYGRIGQWLMMVLNNISQDVFFNDVKEKYKTSLKFKEKKELFSQSDIIFLCCSYDKGDKPIINFDNIRLLKNGVNIINIARAGLINDEALEIGMKEGIISGYATDVLIEEEKNQSICKSRLLKLKSEGFNILITPHIGGAASDAMRKSELLVAEYFQSLIKNKT